MLTLYSDVMPLDVAAVQETLRSDGLDAWLLYDFNGSNPIAIVVPCHRVIGADASLTGYGGGLDRKRWLLAHEQAHCAEADVRQYRMAL